MASLEKELKEAIFDLLENDPDVSAIVGTKIFDTRVPPGPSPPWVRYYIVAESALNDFAGASPVGYRVPITVDCAASGEVATDAETLAEHVFDVLDGASGTTANFSWKAKRTAVRKIYDDDAGVWIVSGDYLFLVSPA